ncbi:MAG: hypothetical protein KDJ14_03630 [Xanthomonadales bacterium]|nr:hypothetical protein [Xanthomonadales bacterium]
MEVNETLKILDSNLAILLFVGFTIFCIGAWQFRQNLAERPPLAFSCGYLMCFIGVIVVYWLPPVFELQRAVGPILFVGFGLVLMNVALAVSDRTRRLRQELASLECLLCVQDRANSQRVHALSDIKEARMAALHRELKKGQLESEAFDGIEREIETRRQIESIRRRLGECD